MEAHDDDSVSSERTDKKPLCMKSSSSPITVFAFVILAGMTEYKPISMLITSLQSSDIHWGCCNDGAVKRTLNLRSRRTGIGRWKEQLLSAGWLWVSVLSGLFLTLPNLSLTLKTCIYRRFICSFFSLDGVNSGSEALSVLYQASLPDSVCRFTATSDCYA